MTAEGSALRRDTLAVHPLRLVVIGAGTVGVGMYSWFAVRQRIQWREAGRPGAGRAEDDIRLQVWPGLIPLGLSLIVAGIVGGVTGSTVAGWGAGLVALAGCAVGYRPVLRRWPHLDIATHMSKDDIWTVRMSDGHGPVFWGIVACAAILIGFAIAYALSN